MMAGKVKKLLLPNIPYILLFWFFSKCGEAYRLSTESSVLHRIIDTISNLSQVLSQPLPSLNPYDLLVGLIGAAAIYGLVWHKKKNAKKWRRDIEYGSARWGA